MWNWYHAPVMPRNANVTLLFPVSIQCYDTMFTITPLLPTPTTTAPYSTVTLFAKFLGWSASLPMNTAV